MKKALVIIILFLVIICGGFIYLYLYNETHVTILGYHGTLPNKINIEKSEFVIDLEKLEKELQFLKKHKYKTLTLKEFLCWKNKKCSKPNKAVLITFDDGYKNNYDYAFPLLKKYNMNAVVFYVGQNSNNYEGNMMSFKEINSSKEKFPNIEFASHSYDLHNHNFKTYEEIDNDIKIMKNIIKTKYFAYPHGEYNEEYIKALKDNGFDLAFTFGPGKEHRKCSRDDNNYKIPRLNISSNMSLGKFKLRMLLPF